MTPVPPLRERHHYLQSKPVDVVRPTETEGRLAVLLWHGRVPNDRDVLAPLAFALAGQGLIAIVPDWQADDATVRGTELLASIAFATERTRHLAGHECLALVGWSLGASAAADLMLHPGLVGGWRPSHFVGIAGPYGRSPFAERYVADGRTEQPGGPSLLLHGSSDEFVPVRRSQDGAKALAGWGWNVRLKELVTDHAGIIGAERNERTGVFVPSRDVDRMANVDEVAKEIASFVEPA